MGVVSLAIAIVLLVALPARRSPLAPHSLGIEEREAVIITFSHLRDRVPELSGWTEEAREIFEEETLVSTVDMKAIPLVHLEKDTLVFSPKFFEADSNAQENALLESVLALNTKNDDYSMRPIGAR